MTHGTSAGPSTDEFRPVFKLSNSHIVIITGSALRCARRARRFTGNAVMASVEELFARAVAPAELEVLSYVG